MKKILFITLLVKSILTGHIQSWNPIVQYDPKGAVNNIIINFNLESDLAADRYLFLKFPFNLGSKIANNLPIPSLTEYQ